MAHPPAIPMLLSGALAITCFGLAAKAQGQGEDNSRAVRIIESLAGQTAASPPVAGAPPMGDIDIRRTSIRVQNPAGVELAILPDVELSTGTRVSLRIATRQPGYLIVVDVDPTGKLTQIYPNRHSLQVRESRETLNLIKPGQPITIPNRDNPFAGFEFVVSPPSGVAMLVAILSDRPVHLVDLPERRTTSKRASCLRPAYGGCAPAPYRPRGRCRRLGRGEVVIRRKALCREVDGTGEPPGS